mmetsp:Transcript_10497/g.10555  ORF Transcript_10497/g.10555 Transcript_10497/m.10555 type:complete len:99 (-) Transcript_10497:320-616(-)
MDRKEKKRQEKMLRKAEESFKKVLQDKILVPNMSYKEAQEVLKDDERFTSEVLEKEKKFEMFKEHMKETFNLKRKAFRDLLEESYGVLTPFASWEWAL